MRILFVFVFLITSIGLIEQVSAFQPVEFPQPVSLENHIGKTVSFTNYADMRIDVSQAQQYYEKNGKNYLQKIISDLSEQTGLSLSVQEGFLEYDTDEEGNEIINTDEEGNPLGSSLARDAIVKGIRHNDTGKFSLVDSGGSHGHGLNFRVDINETLQYINGTSSELNKKTMGFGMIFTHEFLHTDIGTGRLHGKEASVWGKTGIIVNAVNLIRKQLGDDYGQRLSYLSYNYNDKAHIPFDKSNKELIYNQMRTLQKTGDLCPVLSPIRGKYISYGNMGKSTSEG